MWFDLTLISVGIALADEGDNALNAYITQEDGHWIWSSPIYIFC